MFSATALSRSLRLWFLLALGFVATSSIVATAHADSGAAHQDPIAPALLALALILIIAKLGAEVAVRVGQAAVLGELLGGVLLGNVELVGAGNLDWIAHQPTIDALSSLGVILLLFEVGLESTVAQMLRVGGSSLLVALLGVITPFALGWAVGHLLLPSAGPYAHAFLGATLSATSVGITARVLKDLKQAQSDESRIILGAAVIDDVLGLVILAVVVGTIQAANAGQEAALSDTALIIGKSLGFLVISLLLGVWLAPGVWRFASRFRAGGIVLGASLSFCFAVSYAANAIGLAPIVGAFAAGLILEDAHFKDFTGRGEKQLEELLHPLTGFLVPVFFVVMGMRTDLRAFGQSGVLLLALALTAAAIVGKQACSLGVIGKGADRLTVGLGMIPRGEVGLIFANIGLTLTVQGKRVVDQHVFSAVVVMVIVTTMITPPLLKWSLSRKAKVRPPRAAPTSV